MNLDIPKVMGILNVTPDSFYSLSRVETAKTIEDKVKRMIDEGVDIIDVGGCSTRPGFVEPSEEEEIDRVKRGCEIVRTISEDVPLSVDTFRANVASKVIDEFSADIINDISGGEDPEMWDLIAEKNVAYVLTHNKFEKEENKLGEVTADVIREISYKLNEIYRKGVKDVIIDPGFGFGKTTEENFCILSELENFSYIGRPLLIGISRKSMITKTLGINAEESLIGTVALETVALIKGADILRVHDVKETKEIVKLYSRLKDQV